MSRDPRFIKFDQAPLNHESNQNVSKITISPVKSDSESDSTLTLAPVALEREIRDAVEEAWNGWARNPRASENKRSATSFALKNLLSLESITKFRAMAWGYKQVERSGDFADMTCTIKTLIESLHKTEFECYIPDNYVDDSTAWNPPEVHAFDSGFKPYVDLEIGEICRIKEGILITETPIRAEGESMEQWCVRSGNIDLVESAKQYDLNKKGNHIG